MSVRRAAYAAAASVPLVYDTFNPARKASDITLSAGNTVATRATGGLPRTALGTQGKSTGKWMFEMTSNGYTMQVGLATGAGDVNQQISVYIHSAGCSNSSSVLLRSGVPPWTVSGSGPAFAAIMTIGIIADMDARKAWITRNGVLVQGNPAAGTSPSITWDSSLVTLYPIVGLETASATFNSGQSAFSSAVPSGWNAGWFN